VCLLYLPYAGPEAQRVLTAPVLTQVLRAMVLAWEPDCVLTPERFNTDNPERVALADQVRALLGQAGLLKESGDYGPFAS
jgi:hypothetical protein